MNDKQHLLIQGALFGAATAAGVVLAGFWFIVVTSPNAGALVNGDFRPYHTDPTFHIFGLIGATLGLVGIGGLALISRRLS